MWFYSFLIEKFTPMQCIKRRPMRAREIYVYITEYKIMSGGALGTGKILLGVVLPSISYDKFQLRQFISAKN